MNCWNVLIKIYATIKYPQFYECFNKLYFHKITSSYFEEEKLSIEDIDRIDNILSQKVQRLSNIGVLDKNEEAKKKKI